MGSRQQRNEIAAPAKKTLGWYHKNIHHAITKTSCETVQECTGGRITPEVHKGIDSRPARSKQRIAKDETSRLRVQARNRSGKHLR